MSLEGWVNAILVLIGIGVPVLIGVGGLMIRGLVRVEIGLDKLSRHEQRLNEVEERQDRQGKTLLKHHERIRRFEVGGLGGA